MKGPTEKTMLFDINPGNNSLNKISTQKIFFINYSENKVIKKTKKRKSELNLFVLVKKSLILIEKTMQKSALKHKKQKTSSK